MKVCIVSNYLTGYHSIWGGAEQATLLLINMLREKNIEPVIITTKTDINRDNLNLYFVEQDDKLSIKLFNKFLKFSYYNPLLKNNIKKTLNILKPDIVHLQNFSKFSTIIIKEAKLIGIPVVFSVYDYWAFCPNGLLLYEFKKHCNYFHGLKCKNCFRYVPYGSLSYFNTFERIFFKKYLKFIDRFIVLSRNSSNILLDYGIDREKIEIIPLPLYEKIDLDNNYQKGIILFVGWLSPNKGLHIAIKAISKIIDDFPFISLWIVETGIVGRYKEYIINLINKFSLNSKIKFLGKLSNEELKTILKIAHIVVIPEQWYNPLPLILCETINFKKPLVASRIGGIPEVVNVDRFLARYDDPQDFADKITWILKNTSEAFNYAYNLNQRSAEILSQNNIDKIINLYHRLVKKN